MCLTAGGRLGCAAGGGLASVGACAPFPWMVADGADGVVRGLVGLTVVPTGHSVCVVGTPRAWRVLMSASDATAVRAAALMLSARVMEPGCWLIEPRSGEDAAVSMLLRSGLASWDPSGRLLLTSAGMERFCRAHVRV